LERRQSLVNQLQANSHSAQVDLVKWLADNKVDHKIFWVNNTIFVRADRATLVSLAARNDVNFIYGNPTVKMRQPVNAPEQLGPVNPVNTAIAAVEWGVTKVNAPKVWAQGVTGQGVTIAGEDTGYQWDHPAIKAKYRGWNGSSANHSYNWHDAAHSGSSSCAPNAKTPCDDNGHGTHTIGTMVGDDGSGNQIGVAPGAKWIGCRNMISGVGTPATYIECLQWLIAPTDINGNNPDPSKAPDISSHSWGCTASEGCTSATILKTAVDNVVNAGIMVIAAAGNEGSNCSTINDPPGTHDSAFTIASSTSGNAVSSFSSRGPVASAATNKPDITAPGSSVRSAYPPNSYSSLSGTSMATPHVAGVAALVIAANPAEYRGQPAKVAAVLRASAARTLSNSQSCGGVAATTYPNPVVGAGLIDAFAAYQLATSSNTTPTTVLSNEVPVAVNAATNAQLNYSFVVPVPPPADLLINVSFKLVGGTGNGNIYTKLGSAPTTTSYLAKSDGATNAETISLTNPTPGTYYVLMNAASAVNGASIVASYKSTLNPGNVLTSGVPISGISLATNATKTYMINVPAGKTKLTFKLSGGTGDGDIYAKFGAAPTTTSYDAKSDGSTNAETITITAPKAGTYYLLLKAYSSVSGTSLVGTVQ
ncbi:MAG: S8 family serine peptidase, partial [Undibacterium sp.]|nr:S8 family serine peptidase [Undibacterium sp.]